MSETTIHRVEDVEGFAQARRLFQAYQEEANAPICFDNFTAELEDLPRHYCLILLASVNTRPCGCIALSTPKDITQGEIKRLYVEKDFRGRGIGRELLTEALQHAPKFGLQTLYLETLPHMQSAQKLYAQFEFDEVLREQNTIIRMEKKL